LGTSTARARVIGIGNLLLGDEGVGVHVARFLADHPRRPGDVDVVDGGTGGFGLLALMQGCGNLILVDATIDGRPPGTVRRIRPRYSRDFPPSLAAHDIGLKDLLDAFYLLGEVPDVVLYAVSIGGIQPMRTDLSPDVAVRVPDIAARILVDLGWRQPRPVTS
jgi:hydrogenase maturation protease